VLIFKRVVQDFLNLVQESHSVRNRTGCIMKNKDSPHIMVGTLPLPPRIGEVYRRGRTRAIADCDLETMLVGQSSFIVRAGMSRPGTILTRSIEKLATRAIMSSYCRGFGGIPSHPDSAIALDDLRLIRPTLFVHQIAPVFICPRRSPRAHP